MWNTEWMSILLFVLLFIDSGSSQKKNTRSKRLFQQSFPVGSDQLVIGGEYVNNFGLSQASQAYVHENSPQQGISFDITLPAAVPSGAGASIASVPIVSNSLEKPVEEPQESVPRTVGSAIIPLLPPPGIPVNAAAANVPATAGAVFLGSGSLAVINLGGGAYALGSGGLGYSDNRRQPRPSGQSPLYPPLPANPNLIPAATTQPQQSGTVIGHYEFSQSLFNPYFPQEPYNQNAGYEYLPPSRIGFGSQTPQLRRLKATPAYATPTANSPVVDFQHVQPVMPGFGQPIPQLLVGPQPVQLQQQPQPLH